MNILSVTSFQLFYQTMLNIVFVWFCYRCLTFKGKLWQYGIFALIFMICDTLPFLSSDRVVRSLIAYTLMFGFVIFLFKDQFKYQLFVMITYLMILFLPEFLFDFVVMYGFHIDILTILLEQPWVYGICFLITWGFAYLVQKILRSYFLTTPPQNPEYLLLLCASGMFTIFLAPVFYLLCCPKNEINYFITGIVQSVFFIIFCYEAHHVSLMYQRQEKVKASYASYELLLRNCEDNRMYQHVLPHDLQNYMETAHMLLHQEEQHGSIFKEE